MSAKHTPGPWTVVAIDWAETGNARFEIKGIRRTGMADASLIAAAPEMLAALQAVLAEIDGPDRPHSTDSWLPSHLVDQVRLAMVKVEGGAA